MRGRAAKTRAKPSATASSASAADEAHMPATLRAASRCRRYRVPKALRSPSRARSRSSSSLTREASVKLMKLKVSLMASPPAHETPVERPDDENPREFSHIPRLVTKRTCKEHDKCSQLGGDSASAAGGRTLGHRSGSSLPRARPRKWEASSAWGIAPRDPP